MNLNDKLAEIRLKSAPGFEDIEALQKQSIAAVLDEAIMRCNRDRTALTWVIGEIRRELQL